MSNTTFWTYEPMTARGTAMPTAVSCPSVLVPSATAAIRVRGGLTVDLQDGGKAAAGFGRHLGTRTWSPPIT